MGDHRTKLIRIAKLTAGVALLPLGIAMLVTPGPGVPVVMCGLALLQDDFDWAKSALLGLRWLVGRCRDQQHASFDVRSARQAQSSVHLSASR